MEIAKLSQEAQKQQADNALKARQLDIEQFEAETDRMRALREMQEPIMAPVPRAARPSAANPAGSGISASRDADLP